MMRKRRNSGRPETTFNSEHANEIEEEPTGSSEIVKKYAEALKKTKDFVVLHRDSRGILESEISSGNQSLASVTITPAILSSDDSTVLYGYFLEPTNNESQHSRSTKADYENILSSIENDEFVDIKSSVKAVECLLIPVDDSKSKPARKKAKRLKVSRNVSNDEENKQSSADLSVKPFSDDIKPNMSELEVYASIGAKIGKHRMEKVISPSKNLDSVYVGAIEVKNKEMNSTLKFYFDHDLYATAGKIMKDRKVKKVLVEVST